MKHNITFAAALPAAALCLLALPSQAQTLTDSAADPAYASGYAGQNGGSGFGPFVVALSAAGGGTAGTFIFTAAEGEGNRGTPSPSTIDSNHKSFGFYAHGTSRGAGDPSILITRRFTHPLAAKGDTFSLDFVTGYNDGGIAGVALTTGSGPVGRFQYQVGGNYFLNGKIVVKGYKPGALHLTYTLTSPTSYSFTSSGAVVCFGAGRTSSPITGFLVHQTNASNGKKSVTSPDHNGYFNHLTLKYSLK